MITRFQGPDGERRLHEELARQVVVEHDREVAEALASTAELLAFAGSETLITQGGTDTHIDFILAGEVCVEIGGQEIARRRAGTHVGELALIDPSGRRSATVRAVEPTVVARVPESSFVSIADGHPRVWRALARDVGGRLRERERFVRARNARPNIFIGCSTEALALGQELQLALDHDPFVVRVWTDDIFQATHHPTEDLVRVAEQQDFAILIATADDMTTSRGSSRAAPRDNVVFELGLFLGVLGRERTVLVRPRSVDLKLPSDFLGLNTIDFSVGDDSTLTARLGPVATAIRRQVRALGPK